MAGVKKDKTYDVVVFVVTKAGEVRKGNPWTVRARDTVAGRRLVYERLERERARVRSVNAGPHKHTGKTQFVVYLHGD